MSSQQNPNEASSCVFSDPSHEAFLSLICSCSACLVPPATQASSAGDTITLSAGDEDDTTSTYPQSSTADYSNTQSESFSSDQSHVSLYEHILTDNVFAVQNEMIKPFELTTRANEILLCGVKTKDLQVAIVEIWCRSGLNNKSKRLLHMTWYNWVMLDIARRLNELCRRNNGYRLVNEVKQDLSQRLYFDAGLDQNPLFNVNRRSRLVHLANKFGDSICALSEFMDFMQVMEMSDLEYDHLYIDLLKRKDELSDRLSVVSGFFISNRPMGYFSPRTS